MSRYQTVLTSGPYISLFEGKEYFVDRLTKLTPEQKQEIKGFASIYRAKFNSLDWPKVVADQWTYENLLDVFADEIEKQKVKEIKAKGAGKDFLSYQFKGMTFNAPLHYKAMCSLGVDTWCVVKAKQTWLNHVARDKLTFFVYDATVEDKKQGREGSKAWGRSAIYINRDTGEVQYTRASNIPHYQKEGPEEITPDVVTFLKSKVQEVWEKYGDEIKLYSFDRAFLDQDSGNMIREYNKLKDVIDPNRVITDDGGEDFPIISLAAKAKVLDVVIDLAKRGADINKDEDLLVDLIAEDKIMMDNVVSFLLELKANPNLPHSKSGFTPLTFACKKVNYPLVENLIEHGADVNLPTNKGVTPLHAAVAMCADEEGVNIVKLLLKNKADKKAKFNGKIPEQYISTVIYEPIQAQLRKLLK